MCLHHWALPSNLDCNRQSNTGCHRPPQFGVHFSGTVLEKIMDTAQMCDGNRLRTKLMPHSDIVIVGLFRFFKRVQIGTGYGVRRYRPR